MMDALEYAFHESRANLKDIAALTLAVAIGFGIMFFQELRIRNLEEKTRHMKKDRL